MGGGYWCLAKKPLQISICGLKAVIIHSVCIVRLLEDIRANWLWALSGDITSYK